MTWLDTLDTDQRGAALKLLNSRAGRDALRYVGNNPADRPFAAWLAATDALCRRRYGMSIFDLPDFGWRDAHDDELTPRTALADAISNGV